jgi:hypothetical protein
MKGPWMRIVHVGFVLATPEPIYAISMHLTRYWRKS